MKIMNVWCDFSALFVADGSLSFAVKRKVGHVWELITWKIFVQTSKFFLYSDARLSYIHLISISNDSNECLVWFFSFICSRLSNLPTSWYPSKHLNKHNLPLRYDVISHYYVDIEGMTDPIEFTEQNWKDEQSCVHLFFPMMMQLWNILI